MTDSTADSRAHHSTDDGRSTHSVILLLLIASVLACGFLLLTGSYAQARPLFAPTDYLYVSPNGMSTGTCEATSVSGGYSYGNACTLPYALSIAEDGDTLRLSQGTYAGQVEIDKPVTLVGGFMTGFGSGSVDPVPNPTTYETRIGGTTSGPAINVGAAITASVPQTVTLDGLILTHNNGVNGPGLSVDVPTSPPGLTAQPVLLRVINSRIENNTSTTDGGGIVASTDVIVTLGITDTQFSTNRAPRGGAIALKSTGLVVGSNNSFASNQATTDNGGAIYAANGSSFDLTTPTFTNNTAVNNGGAIYGIDGGTIDLTNATFTTNQAGSDGGALFFQNTPGTIGGSATGNSAGGDGGFLYAVGAAAVNLTSLSLTGNTATDNGGTIYNDAGNVILNGGTVTQSIAQDGSGGALYAAGGTTTATDTQFSNNAAASGSGGALYFSGGSATLNGITVEKNNAGIDGGGLFAGNSSTVVVQAGSTIQNNSIPTGVGGGVRATNSNVTLRATTVTDNDAYLGGGGIYAEGGQLTVAAGSDIAANTVITGPGGGIAVVSGVATIEGSSVRKNSVPTDGGGLFAIDASLTISSSFVVTNAAIVPNIEAITQTEIITGRGGGIYAAGTRLEVLDSTVAGNESSRGGGGIYATPLFARVVGSTIEGNNAGTGPGGAGYFSVDLAELEDNIVVNNQTAGNGGAFAIEESAVTVSGNTIRDNTVTRKVTTSITVLKEDVIIEQTGQVVRRAGDVIIGTDATEGIGGALYLINTTGEFDGNIILANDNQAGDAGGLYVNGSVISMTNSVIAQNTIALSSTNGTGLYVINSGVALQHVTVADNVNTTNEAGVLGVGIYVTKGATETSALTLTNNIIAGHEVGMSLLTGSTAAMYSNLWQNTEGDWGGPGQYAPSEGNIIGDPLFVDRINGNYAIQRNSAAFDIGVDAGVPVDLLGVPRPRAFGIDAGAYEQQYAQGVHLEVTASPGAVGSGEIIEYTARVVNHSQNALANVTLNFALPGQQSVSSVTGPGCSGTSCNLGTLAVDQLVDVTLRATASGTPPAAGFLEMTTNVTVSSPSFGESDTQRTIITRLQRCAIAYNGVQYPSLQGAINAVNDGDDLPDTIRVSGYCGGTIRLSKQVTIQGGWNPALTVLDPATYPSTLDGMNSGRVLYIEGSASPLIENLALRNGSAAGQGGGPSGKDAGGIAYITESRATLRNVQMSGGNSPSFGGGLYVDRLTAPIIEDSIIESNSAGEGGGGVYANNSSPELNNVTIRNNSARAGGGVYLLKSEAKINNSTISNNTASGTPSYLEVAGFNVRLSSGGGGGVNFDESKASITGGTIENNTAKAGGAVFADNSPGSITGAIINNNTANGAPIIVPIIVLANTAGGGGAIYAQRSDLAIENNRITNNNATSGPGGAIHIFNGSADGKINSNFIGYNSASKGAAVYMHMNPDTFKIFVLPITIPDFLLPILLGKPQPDPPKLVMQHNTIAHNQGSSAVHLYGESHAEMIANIFAFNSGTSVVAETETLAYVALIPVPIIFVVPIPFPVFYVPNAEMEYTLFYQNGGTTSTTGVGANVSTANGVSGDPAFKDDGFHIKRISAAYNTGRNTGFPNDIDGDTRPQANISDVGADEYPGLGVRYVSPTGGDSGGNFCRNHLNPCNSLQVAIDSARDGDLIKMAGGTYSIAGTRDGQRQLGYITKTLTIQGGYYPLTTDNDVTEGEYTDYDWEVPFPDLNPTVLDAGDNGRVFYIYDPKAVDSEGNEIEVKPVLSGLILQNGSADGLRGPQANAFDAGGAIYLDNVEVTLRDLDISGSSADFGGGIYMISSTIQLEDVVVHDNSATDRGGGFYIETSDDVLIRNITIESNQAPRGAGVYIERSAALLEANQITGNGDANNTVAGGGLYIDSGDAQIISNTITANSALNGAGLYVVAGGAQINDNTVTNNRALVGTDGNGRGGGCFAGPGSALFQRNTFDGNQAVDGAGCYLDNSSAIFRNNSAASNTATRAGGGFYLNNSSDALIEANTVESNTANGAGDNDGGGGIYLEASNSLVLKNTLTGNNAQAGGGAYFFSFSNAALEENTITRNNAIADGGGLYVKLSNVNLTENIITENRTNNGHGGGIYVKLSAPVLTGNRVNANQAGLAGGGLYLDESGAQLNGDSVQANQATNGGGIYLFRSNTARFNTVTIQDNQATQNGGGLYLLLSDITLEDHAIINNEAGEIGGGVYFDESTVSFNRNTLRDNRAGQQGGGIAITRRSNGQFGSNAIVDNNAGATGSGVYVAGASPTLIHTTIARNNGGDGTGVVAVTTDGMRSSVTMVNTILAEQSLAVRATAGNTITLEATLWDSNGQNWQFGFDIGRIITGSADLNFFGQANFDADGIHLQKNSKAVGVGVPTEVGRDIDGNGRIQGGGPELGADELLADCAAVASSDLSIVYTNVQLAINAAQPGDEVRIAGTCVGAETRGGVTQLAYIDKQISVRGGYTPTNWLVAYPLTQSTSLDAQGLGRVIYVAPGFSPQIRNLNLANGNASGQGGGPGGLDAGGVLYVRNANPTLRNLTLVGGSAYYGGGAYIQASTATLRDSTLDNNAATKGGALFLQNSNATLLNNIIINNRAEDGGGIFFNTSAPTVDQNVIAQNAATGAGGGIFLATSAATLNSNSVTTNTAQAAGGIYVDGAAPQLARNLVQANDAQNAGGIYLSKSTAAINGNRVLANRASIGGGVYIQEGNPTLDNNVVAGNTGQVQAAGLYILSSSPRMRHNTIAANSGGEEGGDGSGLLITDLGGAQANLEMVNNILVNHTVGISLTAGNRVSIRSTLLFNNGMDWGGGGTVDDLGGHVRAAPVFVDPAAGNYHIQNSSPARDQGATNAGIAVDFDAQARPADSGFDIGADEFVFLAVKLTVQTIPDPVVAGSPFNLAVSLVNTGNVDQTATFTATLPNGITPSGEIVRSSLVRQGATWLETITAQVAPSANGELRVLVDVTTDAGLSQQVEAILTVAKPDFALQLSAEASPNPAPPGEEITYQIRLSNIGNRPLNPTVFAELPAPVTAAAELSWTPETLGPGGVWTKLVRANVAGNATGDLQTHFRATSTEGAEADYTLTVPIAVPDLVIGTSAAPARAVAGDALTYTIIVSNTGNVDFTGTITYQVPVNDGRPLVAPGFDQVFADVDLPAGGVHRQAVVVTIQPGYSGELTSRIVVQTTSGHRATFNDTRQVSLPTPVVSITAINNGPWSDPATWDENRVPNADDVVLVPEAIELAVLGGTTNPIEVTGLINRGTIRLLCIVGEPMRIEASDFIENSGLIRGADGEAIGEPGCPVEIATNTLTNPGVIRAGDGADGGIVGGIVPPSDNIINGGDGGSASVFAQSVLNDGEIRGGNGGNVTPPATGGRGGDGGDALVVAGPPDPGLLINRGLIATGDGGNGVGQGGNGGNVALLSSAQITIDGGEARPGRGGAINGNDGRLSMGAASIWNNGVIQINGTLYAYSALRRPIVRGGPGVTVLLPVTFLNEGLRSDNYLLLWTNSANWSQNFLPDTFRVNSLRRNVLVAPFVIPTDAKIGERSTVRVTIRSQNDVNLVQELAITVIVGDSGRLFLPYLFNPIGTGNTPPNNNPSTPANLRERNYLPAISAADD